MAERRAKRRKRAIYESDEEEAVETGPGSVWDLLPVETQIHVTDYLDTKERVGMNVIRREMLDRPDQRENLVRQWTRFCGFRDHYETEAFIASLQLKSDFTTVAQRLWGGIEAAISAGVQGYALTPANGRTVGLWFEPADWLALQFSIHKPAYTDAVEYVAADTDTYRSDFDRTVLLDLYHRIGLAPTLPGNALGRVGVNIAEIDPHTFGLYSRCSYTIESIPKAYNRVQLFRAKEALMNLLYREKPESVAEALAKDRLLADWESLSGKLADRYASPELVAAHTKVDTLHLFSSILRLWNAPEVQSVVQQRLLEMGVPNEAQDETWMYTVMKSEYNRADTLFTHDLSRAILMKFLSIHTIGSPSSPNPSYFAVGGGPPVSVLTRLRMNLLRIRLRLADTMDHALAFIITPQNVDKFIQGLAVQTRKGVVVGNTLAAAPIEQLRKVTFFDRRPFL